MTNDSSNSGATLIADIGGTNARFALAQEGQVSGDVNVLACQDYADLTAAASAFLNTIGEADRPRRAMFAVASPVKGNAVQMTNLPWEFSTEQLRLDLGMDTLDIVNDFAAIAWAVPRLKTAERNQVGGGEAHADAPIVIIGPGSGLGVAALIPITSGWIVLPTEGGHVTLAAATAEEDRVLEALRRRFGHVSAERVLSGPGLVNIHTALAELDGQTVEPLSPEEIGARAVTNPGSRSGAALRLFFLFLATTASNAALSFDARGGVYLTGGVLGKLGGAFAASGFRRRFEDKGRFSGCLSDIPTFILNHPFPALAGLAAGPLPPVGTFTANVPRIKKTR